MLKKLIVLGGCCSLLALVACTASTTGTTGTDGMAQSSSSVVMEASSSSTEAAAVDAGVAVSADAQMPTEGNN